MDKNIRELIILFLKSIYDFQCASGFISSPELVVYKLDLKGMTDKKLLKEYERQLDGLIGVKEEAEKQIKSKKGNKQT